MKKFVSVCTNDGVSKEAFDLVVVYLRSGAVNASENTIGIILTAAQVTQFDDLMLEEK